MASEPDAPQPAESMSELFVQLYDELKRIARGHMRRENAGHTLQTTAVVNEAFLRLQSGSGASITSREHFYAIASVVMRRVLVDHARGKGSLKRGDGAVKVPIDEVFSLGTGTDADVLRVDEALQELKQIDPVMEQILQLQFFTGMERNEEIAQALQMTEDQVRRKKTLARNWIKKRLTAQ